MPGGPDSAVPHTGSGGGEACWPLGLRLGPHRPLGLSTSLTPLSLRKREAARCSRCKQGGLCGGPGLRF